MRINHNHLKRYGIATLQAERTRLLTVETPDHGGSPNESLEEQIGWITAELDRREAMPSAPTKPPKRKYVRDPSHLRRGERWGTLVIRIPVRSGHKMTEAQALNYEKEYLLKLAKRGVNYLVNSHPGGLYLSSNGATSHVE